MCNRWPYHPSFLGEESSVDDMIVVLTISRASVIEKETPSTVKSSELTITRCSPLKKLLAVVLKYRAVL